MYLTKETTVRTYENHGLTLIFMIICFVFLVLGNSLFHFGLALPQSYEIEPYFSFNIDRFESFSSYFFSVVYSCRLDIFCVFLIAFAGFTRNAIVFLGGVFAYRSLVFGFCGACLIAQLQGSTLILLKFIPWLIFFLYHIILFSVFICFGVAVSVQSKRQQKFSVAKFLLTFFCEISLVILINMVYYFLISKA